MNNVGGRGLPSIITTTGNAIMPSNYREADDCYDEMSVLSVDTSSHFGGEFSSREKDLYSVSSRKLPK